MPATVAPAKTNITSTHSHRLGWDARASSRSIRNSSRVDLGALMYSFHGIVHFHGIATWKPPGHSEGKTRQEALAMQLKTGRSARFARLVHKSSKTLLYSVIYSVIYSGF